MLEFIERACSWPVRFGKKGGTSCLQRSGMDIYLLNDEGGRAAMVVCDLAQGLEHVRDE